MLASGLAFRSPRTCIGFIWVYIKLENYSYGFKNDILKEQNALGSARLEEKPF